MTYQEKLRKYIFIEGFKQERKKEYTTERSDIPQSEYIRSVPAVSAATVQDKRMSSCVGHAVSLEQSHATLPEHTRPHKPYTAGFVW